MNFPNDSKKKRLGQAASGAYVEDAVGERLRSFYTEITDQKVPQHLLDLLDALDNASSAQTPPSVKK